MVNPSTASQVRRLGAAVAHDQGGRTLLRRLVGQLQAAVPSHGSLVLRTDPRTVLPTDGVVEGLSPAMCKPFWDNELLEEDFNKFVQLARGEVAATLRSATGGDLSRSRRYRSLYQERGITDELRVSFTTRDGCCWGIAQIVRTGGAVFTAAERDLVAGAAGPIASALRARFLAAPPVRPAHGGPALVMLDNAGEIISITAEAREWLAELAKESATGMTPVPEPVYVVARLARAMRTGVGTEPASVLVQTATRGWLQLHASYLDGPESLAGSETLGSPDRVGGSEDLANARTAASPEGLASVGSSARPEGLAGPESSTSRDRLGDPDGTGAATGDGPDGPTATTVDGSAGATGPVAVLLTPARAPELMPLLALGYRLTHRECEVLQLLARGLTTAEMTGYLGISAHTVRDHIKSLFGKVGVRSRAELVARVFADHYFDRFEATLHRVGDDSAAS